MHSVAWQARGKKLPGIWKTYDNSSGLLAGVVSLIQDSNGLIWLATYGAGVACYDGMQYTYYTTADGLTTNHVRRIYQDRDEVIWCKTWGDDIHRFDGERFTVQAGRSGNPRLVVLCSDHAGRLWFGSQQGGVYRYEDGRFIEHIPDNEPIQEEVGAFHRDAQGRFWFGTRAGARCYDGRKRRTFTAQDGLVHTNVRAFCEDAQGRMWFGTQAGISCYDGVSFTNYTTRDGLAHDEIWALYCDHLDRIWVGAFGGGVTCCDGEDFAVYTPEDGLLEESCDTIIQDMEGSFWFAHATTGLSRFEPEFFQPVCPDPVSQGGFTQDPEGRFWYGSYYQLGCIQEDTITRHRLPAQVTEVLADARGGLWVATWGEGLYHYADRERVWSDEPEHLTRDHGLTDLHILALAEDDRGRIWAGSENGNVSYRDGGLFHLAFHHADSGPVSTMLYDRQGRLWAGSWAGGGLSCYDGREVRRYTTGEGLPAEAIRWLMESRDGHLWICTLGGGIARYDGKRFESYSFEEGMWSANVSFAYEDRDGHLWIGCQGGGVHRYDGQNFQILTRQDGLLSSSVSAITQQDDGSIIFATKRGIVRYPLVESPPPPVFILQVIADRVYEHATKIELTTSTAHRVVFQFRGISYKTNRMGYNYRLEGHEQAWQSTWEEEAVYEHLPPGTYQFRVIAINRDLVYSDPPAIVSLVIQPDPRDVRLTALQTEVEHLRREVSRKYTFDSIIGRSSTIQQVYALMEKAIDADLTVLIAGETGTGKELVAKAIHYHSPRRNKPLRELNCGAIPKNLVGATLFGYRKGAFTGAYKDTTGLFEAAEDGTVMLDEIGEMNNEAQVHLLRVLQEQTVQRVGETRLRKVGARVIAITNRDLEAEVRAGRFREDLYYRLSVFPIHLPALRDRVEDIPLLADHFLERASRRFGKTITGVAPSMYEMLRRYAWPGNIRELENEVYRAVALAEEDALLDTYHFSARVTRGESLIQALVTEQEGYTEAVNRFRRQFVETVLRECSGNRSKAARRLGMHRPNLVALIKKLGISGSG